MKSGWYVCAAAALALFAVPQSNAGQVTSDDLIKAQDNRGEWLMYGRDYRNWRYSPLAEITPENVCVLPVVLNDESSVELPAVPVGMSMALEIVKFCPKNRTRS